MANKHRRHSSVDTLGWMYTNRAEEPPVATLDRSISTRISSFRHEIFPALKRQTSLRFNPGGYFAGCFGPREPSTRGIDGHSSQSQHPILFDTDANTSTSTGELPRSRHHSRSLSASFLGNFNFGSMRFGGKSHDDLEMRAAELNRKAATRRDRVLQQPAGRWVMEDDREYYLKPPAWKQVLRKVRAEAKRHVHPAPPREGMDYDAESYEKNFDSGRGALLVVVDEEDELEGKARVLHTKLLTKLHSKRFEDIDALGQDFPATKLLTSVSVPAVPAKGKLVDAGVPIWERRIARPLMKLELTRSM